MPSLANEYYPCQEWTGEEAVYGSHASCDAQLERCVSFPLVGNTAVAASAEPDGPGLEAREKT